MLRTIGVVAAAALLSPISAWSPSKLEKAAATVCNAQAKVANLNFTLKDVNGKDVLLGAYKDKLILLDFWATWCPPCKIEIPGFIDLYNKYKSRGFVVIGVSMDDSTSGVKPFVQKLKMNYPVLLGAGREDIEQAFGVVGLPTSFIIARDGTICAEHMGFTPKEQFEREIKALL